MLTRLGLISEQELAVFLAETLGIPIAATVDFPAEPILEGRATPAFLKTARASPLAEAPDGLSLAMVDPTDDESAAAILVQWAELPVGASVAAGQE